MAAFKLSAVLGTRTSTVPSLSASRKPSPSTKPPDVLIKPPCISTNEPLAIELLEGAEPSQVEVESSTLPPRPRLPAASAVKAVLLAFNTAVFLNTILPEPSSALAWAA